MKTCAVMQPYLFPYIGYYQLVSVADVFIIYDDVTFIKQSYINRNSILVGEQAKRFSLPVLGASSNALIQNLNYASAGKLLKTIQQSYSKSPYYQDVMNFVSVVLQSENRNIARLNELSIRKVFEYLGLDKNIVFASDLEYDRSADRAQRLVSLTKMYGCDHYVNSPGGRMLYDKEYFMDNDIKLSFIEAKITPYSQNNKCFVPGLSIIDILFNCSKSEIIEMLSNYELN